MSLVLASTSATRQRLLHAAGVDFEVAPPAVDEDAAKQEMRAQGMAAHEQAAALAALKALAVSERRPDDLVLGADQMLMIGRDVLDKPKGRAEARDQLLRLRGHTHELATSIVAAEGGAVIWRHTEAPKLKMRVFSDAFLDEYLRRADESVLHSVGGYQLEALGAQLFERMEGDYFSVLGLPLSPLLTFLRERGMLAT